MRVVSILPSASAFDCGVLSSSPDTPPVTVTDRQRALLAGLSELGRARQRRADELRGGFAEAMRVPVKVKEEPQEPVKVKEEAESDDESDDSHWGTHLSPGVERLRAWKRQSLKETAPETACAVQSPGAGAFAAAKAQRAPAAIDRLDSGEIETSLCHRCGCERTLRGGTGGNGLFWCQPCHGAGYLQAREGSTFSSRTFSSPDAERAPKPATCFLPEATYESAWSVGWTPPPQSPQPESSSRSFEEELDTVLAQVLVVQRLRAAAAEDAKEESEESVEVMLATALIQARHAVIQRGGHVCHGFDPAVSALRQHSEAEAEEWLRNCHEEAQPEQSAELEGVPTPVTPASYAACCGSWQEQRQETSLRRSGPTVSSA